MARTFYPHSENTGLTMTVGQLIEKLQALDPTKPVVFRSPKYGCFGSETAYSIDTVTEVQMLGWEDRYPAGTRIDDETGEEEAYEAWTEVFHPWHGVVIA